MAIYYSISSVGTELISLADAKKQLRVDDIVDHEDDLITSYIAEARQIAEGYIGRYIAERTVTIKSTDLIENIEQEYSPIASIESIKVMAVNIGETILSTDDYELVNIGRDSKRIRYEYDNIPTIDTTQSVPVNTVVKVGYNADTVPADIIAAMKLLITWLYENREDRPQVKTQATTNILRRYKKWA